MPSKLFACNPRVKTRLPEPSDNMAAPRRADLKRFIKSRLECKVFAIIATFLTTRSVHSFPCVTIHTMWSSSSVSFVHDASDRLLVFPARR